MRPAGTSRPGRATGTQARHERSTAMALIGNDKDGKLDKILGAGSNPKNGGGKGGGKGGKGK